MFNLKVFLQKVHYQSSLYDIAVPFLLHREGLRDFTVSIEHKVEVFSERGSAEICNMIYFMH